MKADGRNVRQKLMKADGRNVRQTRSVSTFLFIYLFYFSLHLISKNKC